MRTGRGDLARSLPAHHRYGADRIHARAALRSEHRPRGARARRDLVGHARRGRENRRVRLVFSRGGRSVRQDRQALRAPGTPETTARPRRRRRRRRGAGAEPTGRPARSGAPAALGWWRAPGHPLVPAAAISLTTSPAAASTCSQLSSTSSPVAVSSRRCRAAWALPPGKTSTPSAVAINARTPASVETLVRSTHHVTCSVRATACAREVLPTPPGPTTVTHWWRVVRAQTCSRSLSRPMSTPEGSRSETMRTRHRSSYRSYHCCVPAPMSDRGWRAGPRPAPETGPGPAPPRAPVRWTA